MEKDTKFDKTDYEKILYGLTTQIEENDTKNKKLIAEREKFEKIYKTILENEESEKQKDYGFYHELHNLKHYTKKVIIKPNNIWSEFMNDLYPKGTFGIKKINDNNFKVLIKTNILDTNIEYTLTYSEIQHLADELKNLAKHDKKLIKFINNKQELPYKIFK